METLSGLKEVDGNGEGCEESPKTNRVFLKNDWGNFEVSEERRMNR